MADFDLTQTDAQVQSILNDAQNAQGAGAQTTLTTDYIMLKDTSGNYHKILKDSFTEACRNVLAGLLVNNDKGTTISQIPAIASGDFGSVTPANLASVLGVTPISSHTINTGSSVDIEVPIGIIRLSDSSYGTDCGIYAVGTNALVDICKSSTFTDKIVATFVNTSSGKATIRVQNNYTSNRTIYVFLR